jgi:hypothetical protein
MENGLCVATPVFADFPGFYQAKRTSRLEAKKAKKGQKWPGAGVMTPALKTHHNLRWQLDAGS